MDGYVQALITEAEQQASFCVEAIETVYIGGGTPSLLPPALLESLFKALRSILPLEQVREFTVEANPGTLTESWLEAALRSGVNRLSLGMQASQPSLLNRLGRIHCFEDVAASVSLGRQAGLRNISLDLMFGIPGQRLSDWAECLEKALDLHPDHISAYGLIPEPGTLLADRINRGEWVLPDPEEERNMYELAINTLASRQFQQYEISNFSKPGYECAHNIGYWRQIPYLGLGVSAASMLNPQKRRRGLSYLRTANPSSLDDYLRMVRRRRWSLRDRQVILPEEARFETMMLGLRMNSGVSDAEFKLLHGLTPEEAFGSGLKVSLQKNLLEKKDSTWRLTRRGMDFQNQVLVELLPDEPWAGSSDAAIKDS